MMTLVDIIQTKNFLILVSFFKKWNIENKIPIINALATNAALIAVKNKIPHVSNLVKNTDYETKISDIETKYITTADYNKFTKDIVVNQMKSKNLVNGSDRSDFISGPELNEEVVKSAAKAELRWPQSYLVRNQILIISYQALIK